MLIDRSMNTVAGGGWVEPIPNVLVPLEKNVTRIQTQRGRYINVDALFLYVRTAFLSL